MYEMCYTNKLALPNIQTLAIKKTHTSYKYFLKYKKCYVTLHTALVMFSRQLGFKTWRCRKNSGRSLTLCLRHGFAFSHRLETYMTSSNAAALRMQTDHCMKSSKHHESYREQTAPRAFESLSLYFDVIYCTHLYILPFVGIKKH